MQTINIHLADDHQILIDGIKTLLSTIPGFSVVGTSLNGTTIYEEVVQNKADVLVLDISMPEKDGIQVLKEFSKKGFPCKVIILSSYDDLKIVKEVMKLGASGYLTKQCASESIIELCVILLNSLATKPPTLWLGLVLSKVSGCAFSRAINSCIKLSYSASLTLELLRT